MVIQGYNVNVSSQRTFMSVNSTSVSAAGSLNSAAFTGGAGQGSTATVPDNDSGQNQNGQGKNNGNNANTGVGQAQNSGNNGQTAQGQNVNNQGQSNGDIFRSMLENAREETIGRLARSAGISGTAGAHAQKAPTTPQELRARLSQLIYEMMTGRFSKLKQRHQSPHAENINAVRGFDFNAFFGGVFGVDSAQQLQGVEGIQFQSFQYESETVTYQANGVVHTADGKTITLDINMHMSREFVSFMGISADARLVDPLVINYGGTAASLMGEKFMFDLTMDGNMDSLAVLGEGSGFLAIDWEGNGKINDGSQLFGPNTGCGFNELRKYDTDGNGWIDANDEIFDKLVVWRRDADGNDVVYTLKELGIGAIFLGDISTEFSFKSETNETLGVMRSTSFFLKHCGGAGTLSHIDLAL